MKNRLLAVALALLSLVTVASAQIQLEITKFGNMYWSQNYSLWSVPITLGNSATGSQTITVATGIVTLPDSRVIAPFSTTAPITIVDGANTETVTPSAVSNCAFNSLPNSCLITATFANTHGAGPTTLVISGSQGIQEAIGDAASSGGGMVYWQIDPGVVTLATGSANTTLGSVTIPTRSTVLGAVARVTTTIATCAGGWSLGFSTGTEFTAANTTLTAGTTTDSSTLAVPVAFNAAATAPIAHCTTSNASAGALHARIYGVKHVAPAN